MKEYYTVHKEAYTELVEKKSRFLCSVKPVSNENDAQEFIKKINELHKDASHNVYAYIVSENVEIQRASDDREPQGTAGVPILEVIKKENLTNVCIVVTRYFGGILLGAGGLVRAYSSAARSGVHQAGICKMSVFSKLKVTIPYTQLGKIQNIMASMGNNIVNIEYTDYVTLYVRVKNQKVENTINAITELTCGEAEISHIEDYYDVDEVL